MFDIIQCTDCAKKFDTKDVHHSDVFYVYDRKNDNCFPVCGECAGKYEFDNYEHHYTTGKTVYVADEDKWIEDDPDLFEYHGVFVCSKCGVLHSIATTLTFPDSMEHLCLDCAEKADVQECDCCGFVFPKDRLVFRKDKRVLCRDCAEDADMCVIYHTEE